MHVDDHAGDRRALQAERGQQQEAGEGRAERGAERVDRVEQAGNPAGARGAVRWAAVPASAGRAGRSRPSAWRARCTTIRQITRRRMREEQAALAVVIRGGQDRPGERQRGRDAERGDADGELEQAVERPARAAAAAWRRWRLAGEGAERRGRP